MGKVIALLGNNSGKLQRASQSFRCRNPWRNIHGPKRCFGKQHGLNGKKGCHPARAAHVFSLEMERLEIGGLINQVKSEAFFLPESLISVQGGGFLHRVGRFYHNSSQCGGPLPFPGRVKRFPPGISFCLSEDFCEKGGISC
ncbi:MAG: hypothetical protein J1E80_00415 [Desulfovibrionaceae bacterium]|nr:hypothetical protein [Desulfovibrionaceae bacterium]